MPLLFTPALAFAGCLIVLRAAKTALGGEASRSRKMPSFFELCLAVFSIVVFGAVGVFAWLTFLGLIGP